MRLVINGEERQFDSNEAGTIEGLLQAIDIEAKRGVAVAINDEVVPRGKWSERSLDEGDRVEVIRATQGG